jgi:hypothetical protein
VRKKTSPQYPSETWQLDTLGQSKFFSVKVADDFSESGWFC